MLITLGLDSTVITSIKYLLSVTNRGTHLVLWSRTLLLLLKQAGLYRNRSKKEIWRCGTLPTVGFRVRVRLVFSKIYETDLNYSQGSSVKGKRACDLYFEIFCLHCLICKLNVRDSHAPSPFSTFDLKVIRHTIELLKTFWCKPLYNITSYTNLYIEYIDDGILSVWRLRSFDYGHMWWVAKHWAEEGALRRCSYCLLLLLCSSNNNIRESTW